MSTMCALSKLNDGAKWQFYMPLCYMVYIYRLSSNPQFNLACSNNSHHKHFNRLRQFTTDGTFIGLLIDLLMQEIDT